MFSPRCDGNLETGKRKENIFHNTRLGNLKAKKAIAAPERNTIN